MQHHSIVPVALALATLASPLTAQTAYTRSAKDTLRYQEVTFTGMRMTSSQGDFRVSTEHYATIGVVLLPGDTARAWYDSLRFVLHAPNTELAPESGPVLRRPFSLTVDARGRTKLVAAPAFPTDLAAITDLTHQFDDFFMRLPALPLTPGLAWTDTMTRVDTSGTKRFRSTMIAQYRVGRDTVVRGESALVIAVTQQTTIDNDQPMPNQPMRSHTRWSGSDTGWFIFAPKSGRMIARERNGDWRGETRISGAGEPLTIQQAMTFLHRINLQ